MAMPHLKGAVMYRIAGVIVAAVVLTTSNDPLNVTSRLTGAQNTNSDERAAVDVAALLTAARGAPPIICSLAAMLPSTSTTDRSSS